MQNAISLGMNRTTIFRFAVNTCESANREKINVGESRSSETSPLSGPLVSGHLWAPRWRWRWRPNLVLRCLHQVESSVFLHQFLPLPGLNQAVDHSSQCLPFQTEAPPTATLHETRPLFPTAHEKRPNLSEQTSAVRQRCANSATL